MLRWLSNGLFTSLNTLFTNAYQVQLKVADLIGDFLFQEIDIL